MPAERFFIDCTLKSGQQLILEDQEFHHLAHVMRVKIGENVEIVNGRGALATAIVRSIDKKRAALEIETVNVTPPPKEEVILAQAIPRSSRLDFILEKGTELGMTQLWIFPAVHGERKRLTEHQCERMRALTIAAMKQCGRLYLPMIVQMPALAEWTEPKVPSFFGDLDPAAPSLAEAWQESPSKGILFFIGPESGFTSDEIDALRAMQAVGVKLHKNVLRTETAALVALSLISQRLLARCT